MQTSGGHSRFLDTAGICGLAVILTLYMPVVSMAKNAMTALFLIAGFWVLVIALAGGFREVRRLRPALVFLALFAVYLAGNAIYQATCSDCLSLSLGKGGTFAAGLVLVGVAGTLTPNRQLLMGGLGIGLFIGALLLLIELYGNAPIYHWWRDGNVGETFHLSRFNRQTSALVLLSWAPAGFFWASGRRGLAAAVLVIAAAVAFSGESYAAQLSILCGGLAFILALAAPQAVAYLLGGGSVAMVLLAPVLFSRTLAWGTDLYGSVSPSITHRLEIWDHAAARIAERPWFGWGLDQYRNTPVSAEDLQRYEIFNLAPNHVHNNFLQIWVELGALGAAFAIALLILAFRGIGRMHRDYRPFAYGLAAAILSTASVAYGLWQYTWMAMVAMAILCLQLAVSRDQGEAANGR